MIAEPSRTKSRRPSGAGPWPFLALALAFSWLFWIPAALIGQDIWAGPQVWLLYIGGLGPVAAALLLLYGAGDPTQQRDYWRRVFDYRRIRGGWQAAVWLMWPGLRLLALLLAVWTTGATPDLAPLRELLRAPGWLLAQLLFWLVFGPIPEELGWRGYALDRLQGRFDALISSLILGAVWAMWHLPLFFIRGTYQHSEVGLGSAWFWLFVVNLIAGSILYTWVYNNTQRSILSAILFHFTTNAAGEMLPLSLQGEYINAALVIVAAAIVTLVWGRRTLARRAYSRPHSR